MPIRELRNVSSKWRGQWANISKDIDELVMICHHLELLKGRVDQANLATVLKPSVSENGDTNAKLQTRQDKQNKQYDKTARQPLCPLFPEDRVRILNPSSNIWDSGVVQCVADTPHSYLIATEKGGVL